MSDGRLSVSGENQLDSYKISDIDTGPHVSYYGYINKKGYWYIMKFDDTTGQYRYINGDNNYALNWNDRASLPYDYYNIIFK